MLRPISIPRWLLIATAALLAIAIFVIVAHPYLNVASATAGDKMIAILPTLVLTLLAGAALILLAFATPFAGVPQPQPLPILARSCIHRV